MKALSVIELAKLYGMNRQSIYKRISKGDLSKNSDGKIDLSEAIRVFGEPLQRSSRNVTLQSQATEKSAELDIMRQQVDMLQKQLELAQERELFQRQQLQKKDDQIFSLQLLLSAPQPPVEAPITNNENIKSYCTNNLNEKAEAEVSELQQPLQKQSYKFRLFKQLKRILE
jgi:hypothetical protein